MPVNFNAMILPQIATSMAIGSAERQKEMLSNQQMASTQQEMAMRQQKFGREEAEINYAIKERDRVTAAMAALDKHLEDNGGVPGPDGYRMLIATRVPNLVTMGMNGFQMLADDKQINDILGRINRPSIPSQPVQPMQTQPGGMARPSLLPQPENFSVAPTNALAVPQPSAPAAAPTNALAASQTGALRNGVSQDDLIALASARSPRGKDIATMLSGSKSLGAEYLQLSDRYKLLDPKSPEAIDIRKRMDYMTSIERQPQRPNLGTAEGAPGESRVAYQITPGKDGPKVSAVPIPGTAQPTQAETLDVKQRAKLDAAYPKANAAFRFSDNKLDTLIEDVIRLKKNPGLGGVTGLIYGRTPGITDEARSAEADIEALKARGGFNELHEMRIQSPTGGALGNVSDREGVKLEAAFAALKQTQSTEDYKKKLDLLLSQLKVSKGLIRQAFEEEYGYKQNPDSVAPENVAPAKDPYAGLPRVTNNDEFRKLPSGAEFIAPDNTRRRKP